MRSLLVFTGLYLCISAEMSAQANGIEASEFLCATQDFSPVQAARDRDKIWKPKDLGERESPSGKLRIRVKFINGDPETEHRLVEKVALLWTSDEAAAGVEFDFKNHPEAEIRIEFHEKNIGYSEIGTDALKIADQKKPTMLLPKGAKLTPRIILHEFGHALGLKHAHLNPHSTVPWKRHNILRDIGPKNNIFSGIGPKSWCGSDSIVNRDDQAIACLAKIEEQITQTGPDRSACPGEAHSDDRSSIMLYPIKADWIAEGTKYPENTKLSEHDKKCVKRLYANEAGSVVAAVTPPLPYRFLYRKCLKKQLDICKPIASVKDTRKFLEVKTSGETKGDYIWEWKKYTDKNYKLLATWRSRDGKILADTGFLKTTPDYLEGRIDWQQPCSGEAYIRIGNECPKETEEARNIQAPEGFDSEYRSLMQRNSK